MKVDSHKMKICYNNCLMGFAFSSVLAACLFNVKCCTILDATPSERIFQISMEILLVEQKF